LPLNGLFFLPFSVLSIAHALLDGTLLPERAELVEVKSDRGKDHLDVHPWHGGRGNGVRGEDRDRSGFEEAPSGDLLYAEEWRVVSHRSVALRTLWLIMRQAETATF
jgi:hypothetical protein